MTVVLSLAALLIALLGLAVFDSSVLLCAVAAALAVLAALAALIPALKKIKALVVVSVVLAAVSLVCSALSVTKTETSVWDVRNSFAEISALVDTDPARAEEMLDACEYRGDDYYVLRAKLELKKLNGQGVCDMAWSISDDAPERYIYLASGNALLAAQDGSVTTDEYKRTMYDLYKEAAENCPYWSDGYAMAGAYAYEYALDMNSAMYYLAGALNLDEDNVMALYYMGVISCDMGDVATAAEYFTQLLKHDVSESMKQNVALYVYKIEKAVEAE